MVIASRLRFNRRFITLLLLLALGLTIWLTKRWWLESLLAHLPKVEKNADLIQAIDSLFNIFGAMVNALLAVLTWVNRPSAKDSTASAADDRLLTPVTLDHLYTSFGQLSKLEWIDRNAVKPSDLRRHQRIVLMGKSGLGKSREAVELIHRAITDDVVSAQRLFQPGPGLRFIQPESIANQLAHEFDPYQPTLLFIDDLPYHFTGEGLKRLSSLLDAMTQGKALYVVATARDDQLEARHSEWLEQNRFHNCLLRNLDADQTMRLATGIANLFTLEGLSPEVQAAFAAYSDGTPQHPVIALRLLREERHDVITVEDTQIALARSTAEAWDKTRTYIVTHTHHPAAVWVLDALAYFHTARLPAYESLVIPLAAYLARTHRAPRNQQHKSALHRALRYLNRFDIRTENRVVVYRDEIVTTAPAEDVVLAQLAEFLSRFRRGIWHLYKRVSFTATAADEHGSTIAKLAERFQERGKDAQAVKLYQLALVIFPNKHYYYSWGIVYAKQRDFDKAIAAYQRAIALDPQDAPPHHGLGNAYRALGQTGPAIAAYQRASELDPKYALPHNNLGIVYRDLGETDKAIAAYQRAIELDPKFAYPHYGLGNVYSDLGQTDKAIAAYQRGIELDPQDAPPHFNLGNVYVDLGQTDKAIAAYQRAIELDPKFAAPHHNLGTVYRDLGQTDKAIAAYQRAIELDPKYALPHHGLGNVYYALGETDKAIAAYQHAIELDPQRAAFYGALAGIYRAQGDEAAYQRYLTLAQPRIANEDDYNRACFASISGDVDGALALLQTALAKAPGLKLTARRDPDFAFIRDDPRFQALVAGEP